MKKKSIIIVLVSVLVLALLAGCGIMKPKPKEEKTTEETTTKQVETTTKEEEPTKSGRLDDVYEVIGYSFPVSSEWLREDEIMDETMYFYSEDNMTFIMFQTADGNFPVDNETFQDQFVQGFSSGMEEIEVKTKESVTLKNGVKAFHLIANGKIAGLTASAELYSLNGDDDKFLTIGVMSMNDNAEMKQDFKEMMDTFTRASEKKEDVAEKEDKPEKDEKSAMPAPGTVLLDDSYVLITFKEIKDGVFGQEIKVEVQNKFDKPILVQCDEATVDGYMIDALMSKSLQPGKKSVESITFFDEDMADIGVDDLTKCSELLLHIRVMDDDSWDELNEMDVTLIAEPF